MERSVALRSTTNASRQAPKRQPRSLLARRSYVLATAGTAPARRRMSRVGGRRAGPGLRPLRHRRAVIARQVDAMPAITPSTSPLAARQRSLRRLAQVLQRHRIGRGPENAAGRARRRGARPRRRVPRTVSRRPAADELDLDVLVGAKAGELDHPPGHVDDPDRLAHVENEDFAAPEPFSRPCAEACSVSSTASRIVMK